MAQQERFHDLPLEEVIGDRFGRYSKYIIQDRALPDARDGLKPVQRRILYAMYAEGNTQDKNFRKAAKTVGNVIGNYHPHGDSSVYEAMVRMSQDWKVRNVLIEMHGNNGSIDGDPPAAMRYTEARLSAIASELLKDLDKETVEFVANFDDTSKEPVVLPAMFPNLLVNGSTGISAGYATDIPPHHLGEVIDGVIKRIEQPHCTVEDLMTVIKGPDFPTGGIIQGVDGIKKAYETGKGKIMIRGKAEIETIRGGRQQIVITEIPYEVNKANLVKKMDEFRIERKVEGISEVRDETDRTGLRIVVELKKEADANGVLNFLYKNSDLQIPYNFNMVAIHNRRPTLMTLTTVLDAYIAHQKEVVTNRSAYELRKAKERHHIVDGLIKALSILDEVIATIRSSNDKRDAKNNLMEKYDFTEAQSEAIVSLQLYRLTNTDITQLRDEARELDVRIAELEDILANEKKLFKVITNNLKKLKKTYADERRSVIEEKIEEIKINLEVMIASEDVYVTVTKDGYIKRTSQRSYAASNGKDFGMKDTDRLIHQFEMNTTDVLLLFTNKGSYIYCPVHQLPDIRWKDMGQHITNIISIDRDESIQKAIPIKEFDESSYLLFFTKGGMVKKTELLQYKAQRYSKPLVALNLKGDDELVDVHVTTGQQELFIATKNGYGLWFDEEEVSVVGPRAAGVKGINLKDGDEVVSGQMIDPKNNVLVLTTQRGAVKRMNLSEFDKTSRAKRGVIMLRELKKNPHRIVAVIAASLHDTLEIDTEKGATIPLDISTLRANDRYSNGSFILDEEEQGEVTQVLLSPAASDQDDNK
ncbi:DNA topoisomerase IV subunit A [Bacillus altitudinis MN12]|uniref:DNA topoisomerase 4 subunit A n=1 Tax=Bacillus aerius TaxID=293388 RepID=A0ABR6AZR7_9BACI|nr:MULTISPECIES: DNA topoisomerase IV subunit A [Bacillus]MCA1013928.1 DNA topoisomerase IV subunit A [Bacillus stratosphericus]CVM95444.1 topoisomerase IV subunit A%2C ParC [Streptococcus pneumoniae]ATP94094.1 DNA topoisomerase IV subunit A [Bacillus altitudinis]EIL85597.1 DNA topoisomerase IV, A subunit [Bacillus sp. M 2-6]MBA8917374.1 topoisomerase-4 subunit A [Bacillus aerius]